MEPRDVGETPAGVSLCSTMPNRVDCFNPMEMPHQGCTSRRRVNFSCMLNGVNAGYVSVDEPDFSDSVDSLVVMVRIDFATHFALIIPPPEKILLVYCVTLSVIS